MTKCFVYDRNNTLFYDDKYLNVIINFIYYNDIPKNCEKLLTFHYGEPLF